MENNKKNKKSTGKIQYKNKNTRVTKSIKVEKEEIKTSKANVESISKRKTKKVNRKNVAIILGVIVLLIVFLVVLLNMKKNDDNLDVLEEKGDKIDLTDTEEFTPEILIRDYIKGHNIEQKNTVYYDVPKELAYNIQDSEFSKQYIDATKNVNYSIIANVFYNITTDELIDRYQEILNENNYIKSSYTLLKNRDNNVKILKFDYVNSVKDEPDLLYTGQEIYFILETEGNDLFCLEYNLLNQKMSDRLLIEIANGIEVQKGKGKYLILTKDNNVLKGTMRSIDRHNNTLYKFNLTIDANKYVEVEEFNNSYNETTLKNRENNEIVTIKTSYNSLGAIKKTISNVKETKVTINGKVFTKLYNNEITYYVYVTENKNTFEVVLKTNGKSKIEDFTNFVVEKEDK